MDRKKRIKMVLTICFVLVCGAICVWMHYGQQRKEQIVWEQSSEVSLADSGISTQGTEKHENTESLKSNKTSSEKEEISSEDKEENEPDATKNVFICVHLCGAVTTEGVYTLPEGSRLVDGVTAAGGFLSGADTSYHNLASLLTDGQKVYIPTKEETKDVSVSERADSSGNADLGKNGNSASVKVNINTAGIEELTTLSGIGESKAKSIIQYREKVGAFLSIEELKHVSGIGDAMFERVKEEITVK